MTVGTSVGPQGCVPLVGECEIRQLTAATDVITIKGAASISGKFLNCVNSADTSLASIDSAGAPTFASWPTFKGAVVAFASNATSASATLTGITSVDVVVACPQLIAGVTYYAVPASGKVTVYASASIGSACTFNVVAFHSVA
jgi:hypothetical protein